MQTNTIKAFFVALLALCLPPWASADSYSYDNLNRLTAVGYTSAGGQTYGYDPAGNLLSLVSTPAAGSNYNLMVQAINSTGSGTVTGPGINCSGANCSASVVSGSIVTLTATPAAGSSSIISGPGCSASPCTFIMPAAAVSVSAIFVAQTYAITANASPTIGGTVSGMGTGAYAAGAVRGITATANAGYTFTGWSGYVGCTTANPCNVTMPAAPVNLTALFTRVTSALSVSASPAAGGTVSGAGSVAANSLATVTATANPGYTFTGWSGYAACASLNPCSFNMPASAVNLLAVFSATTFPLTVSKLGSGSGSVSSTVAGINCGVTCSANFTSGASVTLTAAASPGSTFAGWNGACSGAGSCVVSMSAAQGVMATFALNVPGISFNPPSITFANQNVGIASAAQTVTLANTDVSTLTITSIVPTVPVFGVVNNCPATLAPGSSCTFNVTFSPVAAGARVGSITVTTNAGGSPHSVSVTGTGVSSAPPVCTLTASPATVLPGQSSTLLASCSPAATSFSWSGGTCAGLTTSSCTVAPSVATSYSVTGTNSFGSNTASAEVSIREDLVYTPVTPCRIIDTRFPTPNILGPNSGRDFGITSSDYSAQGGQAGSCGIPANASAVAINVVSTGQSGLGHLRVIQSGVAVPNVAFLNYRAGVNTANAGIARVAAPSSTNGLFIYSGGSQSHAVVDIMGYFSAAASQAPINMEANPGVLNLASPVVICQSTLTPTQNWTARPSGSVSLLADASGALNWGIDFVYSTNAGASWNAASGQVMRSSSETSSWGYSASNASDVVSLNAATPYNFGIRVQKISGAGNVANSQCALSVGLE